MYRSSIASEEIVAYRSLRTVARPPRQRTHSISKLKSQLHQRTSTSLGPGPPRVPCPRPPGPWPRCALAGPCSVVCVLFVRLRVASFRRANTESATTTRECLDGLARVRSGRASRARERTRVIVHVLSAHSGHTRDLVVNRGQHPGSLQMSSEGRRASEPADQLPAATRGKDESVRMRPAKAGAVGGHEAGARRAERARGQIGVTASNSAWGCRLLAGGDARTLRDPSTSHSLP